MCKINLQSFLPIGITYIILLIITDVISYIYIWLKLTIVTDARILRESVVYQILSSKLNYSLHYKLNYNF